MIWRIGSGFDIHQLVTQGRPLVIGGIPIPYEKNVKAHSDGDVLLHAITDALLGALALGDIGSHFPDHAPEYDNLSSAEFLQFAYEQVRSHGFLLVNLDANVILEQPKLRPFIEPIRQSIATLLDCDLHQISIKAKTHEKLDAIGAGKAISTQVVVLLEKC